MLDVLRWELERLKVDVRTGYEVTRIVRAGERLRPVARRRRRAERRGALVLASGGRPAPQFGSDGSG